MSFCSGAMIKDDEMVMIKGQINDINLTFKNDRKYWLSLDQSTTCTGVYFTDEVQSFHLLLDLTRTSTPKEEFFRQLKFFLIRLVSGKNIEIFLMEDVPNTDDRHTKYVLRELKRLIESWRTQIPELDRAIHESVLPQTWKKEIINKSKGTGRGSSKRKMAEDLCDRLPELKKYLEVYNGEGYDCFDACGIAYGYIMSRHTSEGQRKIMGPLNRGFVYEAFYVGESKIEGLKNIINLFTSAGIEVVTRVWNDDYGVRDNYRMASGSDTVTITYITDDKLRTRLLWEFDLSVNESYFCVIVRKVHIATDFRVMLQKLSNNCVESF